MPAMIMPTFWAVTVSALVPASLMFKSPPESLTLAVKFAVIAEKSKVALPPLAFDPFGSVTAAWPQLPVKTNESLPAPPVNVSFPDPTLMTSSKLLQVMVSLPLPQVRLDIESPLLRPNESLLFTVCMAVLLRSTVMADVVEEKSSVLTPPWVSSIWMLPRLLSALRW